jgi:hypothetical protein
VRVREAQRDDPAESGHGAALFLDGADLATDEREEGLSLSALQRALPRGLEVAFLRR